jgi:hypothetical protein
VSRKSSLVSQNRDNPGAIIDAGRVVVVEKSH